MGEGFIDMFVLMKVRAEEFSCFLSSVDRSFEFRHAVRMDEARGDATFKVIERCAFNGCLKVVPLKLAKRFKLPLGA